jgi:hypothetical protein
MVGAAVHLFVIRWSDAANTLKLCPFVRGVEVHALLDHSLGTCRCKRHDESERLFKILNVNFLQSVCVACGNRLACALSFDGKYITQEVSLVNRHILLSDKSSLHGYLVHHNCLDDNSLISGENLLVIVHVDLNHITTGLFQEPIFG